MMTRKFSTAITLALLIQAGVGVTSQAQNARLIQFSEPRSDKINTNLNRLGQGLSRLDRLESELSRPFDFASPGDSMKGGFISAPLPTPPPAVNNPRVKELIDRKRDLPFMTQEEIFLVHSPEERLEKLKGPELTPDGRDRSTLRPMERALLPRDNPLDANRNSMVPGSETSRQNDRYDRFREINENPNLRGISDLERNLRKLAGNGPLDGENRSEQRTTDFFGMGENPASKMTRRTGSDLQRIEQFKQLYDFGTRPETAAGGNDPLYSNPYLESSFYDPPMKSVAPSANVFSSPSFTEASAFGGNSPAYTPLTPPPSPAPVFKPSPSPFVTVPKRGF